LNKYNAFTGVLSCIFLSVLMGTPVCFFRTNKVIAAGKQPVFHLMYKTMAETTKEAQPTQPDRSDNKSVYEEPVAQKKTEQGEVEKNPAPGSAYGHMLPEKEEGEETTDGMNEV
jgi:hypothetical protein